MFGFDPIINVPTGLNESKTVCPENLVVHGLVFRITLNPIKHRLIETERVWG